MTIHRLIATRRHFSDVKDPNLSTTERTLSISAGAALMLNGIRTGGLRGVFQACLGTYAVFRGASGNCALKSATTHTPFEEEFQSERGWKNSKAVSRSITLRKPKVEVMAFMREPKNIGQLIAWVNSVEVTGSTTSEWSASAPLGRKLHWALTLQTIEADALHWRVLPDSMWEHDISAHFAEAPANRGTEIKVVVVGKPPLGKLGYAAANAMAQFTDKALLNLLHSIKQKLETGEVSTNHLRPDQSKDFFYVHPAAGEGSGLEQSSDMPVKTGVVLEEGNV
jgi:uncharacterized membrane protein